MAEFRSHGDNEAHIGAGQLVKGVFILIVAPADGQIHLMLLAEHRFVHGGSDKTAVCGISCRTNGHGSAPHHYLTDVPS